MYLSVDEIPLLLTSSVTPHDDSVAVKAPEERRVLGLESVKQWRRIRPNSPLVLCDGSGYDFTNDIRQLFPNTQMIECLHFLNPIEIVKQKGRGYGEGEIVKCAVKNSKFIASAGAFAKCTSKLWVDNFNECMRDWHGQFLCQGVFLNVFEPWRKIVWHQVDTRFYISSVEIYKKYFMDVHALIGEPLDCLEQGFKYVIEKARAKDPQVFSQSMFKNPPIVQGVGGGSGESYKTPLYRVYKEKWRVRLVKSNNSYASLFAA